MNIFFGQSRGAIFSVTIVLFSDHPQNTRVFKKKLLFLALQTQAVAASLDDLKGDFHKRRLQSTFQFIWKPHLIVKQGKSEDMKTCNSN